MANSQTVMQSAIEITEELEKILCIPFGPSGKAVMLLEQVGEPRISRCGYTVLNAVVQEQIQKNPILSIILDSVRTVYNRFGDGIKSFIFFLSVLLKSFEKAECIEIARQISKIQASWYLDNTSNVSLELVDSYEKILRSFLHTRFTPPVATALAAVLLEWLRLTLKQDSEMKLQCLLKKFNLLCRYKDDNVGAVSNSCVLPGFIINQPATNLKNCEALYKLKILHLQDYDQNEIYFNKFVSAQVLRWLQTSGNVSNALILTSAILPPLALFYLHQKGAAVIQGVHPDELKFICSFTEQKLIVSVVQEFIRQSNCTRIILPNTFQLVLYGPLPSLCYEYSVACNCALKLLGIVQNSSSLIPAGAFFERSMSIALISKVKSETPAASSSKLLLLDTVKSQAVHSVVNSENELIDSEVEAYLAHCDIDTIFAVVKALISISSKLSYTEDTSDEFVDIVEHRLAILHHALATVAEIIKIDEIIVLNTKIKL